MTRAVRFDKYGGIDVLHFVEVDRPVLAPDQARFLQRDGGTDRSNAARFVRTLALAFEWFNFLLLR